MQHIAEVATSARPAEFDQQNWPGPEPARGPAPAIAAGWAGQAPLCVQATLEAWLTLAYAAALSVAPASVQMSLADSSPAQVAAMLYSTVLWALLVKTDSVTRLIPLPLEQTLEVAAALWVIGAKRILKRGTAMSTASRPVIDRGAYRFIRHPIYTGRAVLFGTVLMSNFNAQNLVILFSIYLAQLFLIMKEEEELMQHASYRSYAARVPYRMIYGIY